MRITSSLVLTCGLAWAAPALAEEVAAAFEYSPVARLVQGGQFRAEVWRRDVATDSSDVAWSDAELSPTAAKAIGEACAALQKNFDPDFACSLHQGSVSLAAKPKVASKALTGPPPTHKAKSAHAPPRVAAEPAAASDKANWAKDFWKEKDAIGGFGGGAGGGGGSE
jgi:hypothetical protein